MLNTKLKLTLALAALAAVTALAQTQTTPPAGATSAPPVGAPASPPVAATPAPPPPTAFDKWVKEVKNPTDWLTWGADLRLRNEYFDNALTLGQNVVRHEQDYFRFRERLWDSIMPVTNLSINARLATEQREWMKPSFAKQYGYRPGMEERYVILDNANVKWSNALDLPMSITAGRQDIMLGDPLNWWLVCDGTPYDGSWTMFLDSIRLTGEAKETKTKFDLIYIYQNALPDEWVPTIGRSTDNAARSAPYTTGSAPYWLTEQNEQGVIFYVANKSIKDTEIDAYFIYKHDSQEGAILSPFTNSLGAKYPLGDNADIYTIGGKVTGNPFKHWKYSVEGAYQFGDKQDPTLVHDNSGVPAGWGNTATRTIDAFGVNSSLTYLFKDRLNNQASLIFEYLSGDDPKTTGKDEMFDVLWGRWPRFSELYIYSYPNETSGKFAQLNNIMRIGPSWSFSPIKDTTFSAMYNALFAPEETPTRDMTGTSGANPEQFSRNGNFRGHYIQTVLKHKFNDHVSAHLWGEYIWQGDYYSHSDLMTFVRAEVILTF
ncbi:MAG: alginate export family protein [Verrucomicrobiota bacterium]|jgi:hypothetical protein